LGGLRAAARALRRREGTQTGSTPVRLNEGLAHPASAALDLVDSGAAIRSATASMVVMATVCNRGGLETALNWALHARRVGIRPIVGIDGRPPRWATEREHAAWTTGTGTLFTLLPSFEEAFRETRRLAGLGAYTPPASNSSLPSSEDAPPPPPLAGGKRWRETSRPGFEFWHVRWYSVHQMLKVRAATPQS